MSASLIVANTTALEKHPILGPIFALCSEATSGHPAVFIVATAAFEAHTRADRAAQQRSYGSITDGSTSLWEVLLCQLRCCQLFDLRHRAINESLCRLTSALDDATVEEHVPPLDVPVLSAPPSFCARGFRALSGSEGGGPATQDHCDVDRDQLLKLVVHDRCALDVLASCCREWVQRQSGDGISDDAAALPSWAAPAPGPGGGGDGSTARPDPRIPTSESAEPGLWRFLAYESIVEPIASLLKGERTGAHRGQEWDFAEDEASPLVLPHKWVPLVELFAVVGHSDRDGGTGRDVAEDTAPEEEVAAASSSVVLSEFFGAVSTAPADKPNGPELVRVSRVVAHCHCALLLACAWGKSLPTDAALPDYGDVGVLFAPSARAPLACEALFELAVAHVRTVAQGALPLHPEAVTPIARGDSDGGFGANTAVAPAKPKAAAALVPAKSWWDRLDRFDYDEPTQPAGLGGPRLEELRAMRGGGADGAALAACLAARLLEDLAWPAALQPWFVAQHGAPTGDGASGGGSGGDGARLTACLLPWAASDRGVAIKGSASGSAFGSGSGYALAVGRFARATAFLLDCAGAAAAARPHDVALDDGFDASGRSVALLALQEVREALRFGQPIEAAEEAAPASPLSTSPRDWPASRTAALEAECAAAAAEEEGASFQSSALAARALPSGAAAREVALGGGDQSLLAFVLDPTAADAPRDLSLHALRVAVAAARAIAAVGQAERLRPPLDLIFGGAEGSGGNDLRWEAVSRPLSFAPDGGDDNDGDEGDGPVHPSQRETRRRSLSGFNPSFNLRASLDLGAKAKAKAKATLLKATVSPLSKKASPAKEESAAAASSPPSPAEASIPEAAVELRGLLQRLFDDAARDEWLLGPQSARSLQPPKAADQSPYKAPKRPGRRVGEWSLSERAAQAAKLEAVHALATALDAAAAAHHRHTARWESPGLRGNVGKDRAWLWWAASLGWPAVAREAHCLALLCAGGQDDRALDILTAGHATGSGDSDESVGSTGGGGCGGDPADGGASATVSLCTLVLFVCGFRVTSTIRALEVDRSGRLLQLLAALDASECSAVAAAAAERKRSLPALRVCGPVAMETVSHEGTLALLAFAHHALEGAAAAVRARDVAGGGGGGGGDSVGVVTEESVRRLASEASDTRALLASVLEGLRRLGKSQGKSQGKKEKPSEEN